MPDPSPLDTAAIALNRFGLGARPDEPVPAHPRAWLLGQFERYSALPQAWADQPGCATQVMAYVDYLRELRQASAGNELAVRQTLQKQTRQRYRAAVNARAEATLQAPAPFVERLVHFWSNHFAVSIDKAPIAALAGAFEAEAIRPHVLGRFEDLLLAVERHPAMLMYLDQARSMGPGSVAVQRFARDQPERQRGLNENLAREILELHTLGVRSGYGQDDVTELARALTGGTVGGLPGLPYPARLDSAARGGFGFQSLLHEPGVRTVLGRRYEQRGVAQAEAVLRDLAAAPATAQHIAYKLARHFAGDTPPQALVERLAAAFTRSGGDLPGVYRALVESPEVWAATSPKFKTPWEWTLSAMRGLGWHELQGQQLAPMLTQLGQTIWRPGSPAGYDDMAESWAAPDALMRRVEWAQRLAARAGSALDARVLGPKWVPGGLSEATVRQVARAESPATALALLLVSPEFLRR